MQIEIKWTTDDVLTVRGDLTAAEADHVLQETLRRHDATIGVTWDVIQCHADELYPRGRPV